MNYLTEDILNALREARIQKGLSQKALSDLAGLPQGHISKIESGGVDLRLSSLITVSRALGLELFLAPRSSVPAVNTVIRRRSADSDAAPPRAAYELDEDEEDD